MKRFMRNVMAVVGVVLALSSCSTFKAIHEGNQSVNSDAQRAQRMIEAQQHAPARSEPSVVTMDTTGYWVNTKAVKRSEITPAALRCPIAYAPKRGVPFSRVADQITAQCGVAVRLTADAMDQLAGTLGARSNSHRSSTQTVPAPAGALPTANTSSFPPVGGVTWPGSSSASQSTDIVTISYSGKLSGLLNAVTGQLGLSWRFDAEQNVVVVSYLQTKSFTIAAIPTTTGVENSVTTSANAAAGSSGGIGGGSGGGSGGGGGIRGQSQTQSHTNVSLSSDVLKDLNDAITSMLTPGVGRMAISSSTGVVTVTDTPDVVNQVGSYIALQNQVLSRQVRLFVKVLAVDLSHGDSVGINWDAIYTALKQQYSFNLSSNYQPSTSGSTAAFSILNGSKTRWGGSQAIIDALNTQGNVSTLYSSPLTTLNLQPVPIQVSKQKGYVAQSSISQTAQVGSLQSRTPGSVTTGFSMSVLPYILPDDKTVLLQFGLNISRLDAINHKGDDQNFIETPDTSASTFSEKVSVHSGSTLVMTGYLSSENTVNKQGVGNVNNFVLGGGAELQRKKKIIVVLVTPQVMR